MKIRTLLAIAITLVMLVSMIPTALAADTTPPSSWVNGVYGTGDNGWYRSDVTVGISASDNTILGVKTIYYSFDGANFRPIDYNFPSIGIQVTSEGTTTVYFYAEDKAGIREPTVHQQIVKIDRSNPVTTASPSGDAGVDGWFRSDVTIALNVNDPLSGGDNTRYSYFDWAEWLVMNNYNPSAKPVVHTGDVGSDGKKKIYFRSSDKAGNVEDQRQYTVKIDTQKPTITVSPAPSANWYTTNPTFTFTFSDSLSGMYQHSDNPVTIGDTTGTDISAWATDKAGNTRNKQFNQGFQVKVDTTKPSTVLVPARAANGNGWYNSPVDISFTANDATSGMDHTSYKLVVNGVEGSWQTYTGSPVTISAEDTTVVKYYSVDVAGNTEDEKSYTIRIDSGLPTIVVNPTPSASWYTTNPTFTFTFDDSLSGVDVHSPEVVTQSTDNAAAVITASVTDKAGNTEDMSFTIMVDTTAPVISGAVDRTPNAQNWYKDSVTITFTAADATSGLASENPQTVVLNNEGADQSATRTATDNAGNTASATVDNIDIDKTAPATSHILSDTVGTAGWYTTDVTVTLSADDTLSHVKSTEYNTDGTTWTAYTAPLTFSAEGATTVHYRSTDNADNVESEKTVTFNVDKTAPVSTAALSGTIGENGWYVGDVTVTVNATDSGTSGLKGTEYSTDGGTTWTAYTAPVTVSSDGIKTVEYRSTDNAGNIEATKSVGFSVDQTVPVLTGTLNGYRSVAGWFDADATLVLSYDDAASGISSVMYSLDGSRWSTYTGTVTVPKSSSHYVYFGAKDNAGNVKNGSVFAYFTPGTVEYIYKLIAEATQTANATATPTATPYVSAGATVTPTPEVSATPSVTPTPQATTTAQTQPGNNWWVYLLLILIVGLGAAGAFFLFRKH